MMVSKLAEAIRGLVKSNSAFDTKAAESLIRTHIQPLVEAAEKAAMHLEFVDKRCCEQCAEKLRLAIREWKGE